MTTETPLGAEPAGVRTLPVLIRAGVLDAELAALAWLALDGRIPLLVAGKPPSSPVDPDPAAELAAAFEPFLPVGAGRARMGSAGVDGDAGSDVLVAGRLGGGDLRRAVRGAGRGFGLLAAVAGTSLAEVLDLLRALPVGATDAEVGRLGLVLVADIDPPGRVVAAHYLRPVVRDAGGHLRHLDPAVLAVWDTKKARFDHFGWAIYPELADRTGRRAGDVERAHGERAAWLGHAVSAGHGDSLEDLERALAARARR